MSLLTRGLQCAALLAGALAMAACGANPRPQPPAPPPAAAASVPAPAADPAPAAPDPLAGVRQAAEAARRLYLPDPAAAPGPAPAQTVLADAEEALAAAVVDYLAAAAGQKPFAPGDSRLAALMHLLARPADPQAAPDAGPLVADVDGDRRPDVVMALALPRVVYAFLQGAGGWRPYRITTDKPRVPQPPSAGDYLDSVADVTGDGTAEVLVRSQSEGSRALAVMRWEAARFHRLFSYQGGQDLGWKLVPDGPQQAVGVTYLYGSQPGQGRRRTDTYRLQDGAYHLGQVQVAAPETRGQFLDAASDAFVRQEHSRAEQLLRAALGARGGAEAGTEDLARYRLAAIAALAGDATGARARLQEVAGPYQAVAAAFLAAYKPETDPDAAPRALLAGLGAWPENAARAGEIGAALTAYLSRHPALTTKAPPDARGELGAIGLPVDHVVTGTFAGDGPGLALTYRGVLWVAFPEGGRWRATWLPTAQVTGLAVESLPAPALRTRGEETVYTFRGEAFQASNLATGYLSGWRPLFPPAP